MSGEDRGARRASLRRGGEKTPILKTVIRTDAVVANSRGLRLSAEVTSALLETVAEDTLDPSRKQAVVDAALARRQVAEAYGDCDHSADATAETADQSKLLYRENHEATTHSLPSWPTRGIHAPVAAFVSSATRLAALASSFATIHRAEEHVENDVTEAIGDAQRKLAYAYEALDDEVFSVDADSEVEVSARIVMRRSRQLAGLAATDRRGEVFASELFDAARSSFVDGAKRFNVLYMQAPLLDTKLDVDWFSPIAARPTTADAAYETLKAVASKVRDASNPMLVRDAVNAAFSRVVQLRGEVARGEREVEWGDDVHMAVLAESHTRVADALYKNALKATGVTNHRVRARRHLDLALCPTSPADPLGEPHSASTNLRLCDWVAHAERTNEAEFEVIGGFSVGLDGSFQFHTAAEADRADWLTLRARTTAASLATDESASELAHSSATAAWRSLSYDTDMYEAPFFRPSTQHIEAASRFGIALCGRGNVAAKNPSSDADVVHIDESVAQSALGMRRLGNMALLSNASVVIGFMFGADEVATAEMPSPTGVFLGSDANAPPHPIVPFCEERSENEINTAAAEPVLDDLERRWFDRLLTEPIDKVYARVLHESPSKATLEPPPAPVEPDLKWPDADRASGALRAAIGAVIEASSFAMDDVVQRIADTSSLWHAARAPGAAAVLHARQAEYLSAPPARRLYASLGGHGARHADVAASRLGLLEVASLVGEDLFDHIDGDEQQPDTSHVSSKAMREAAIDEMAFDTSASVELDTSLYHSMAPGALDPVAGAALLASCTRRLTVSGLAFTGWSRVY